MNCPKCGAPARRITVGPMIALFGFVMMIAAILFKKKDKE